MDGSRFLVRQKPISAEALAEMKHESPAYLHARGQWNDRLKQQERQTRLAWWCCAGSTGLAAIAIGGCIYLGQLPKQSVEYLALDPQGAFVRTFSTSAMQVPDLQALRQERLAMFVRNLRTVVTDTKGQAQLFKESFAVVAKDSPAEVYARKFFNDSNPYEIGKRGQSVQAEIISLNPASANTWHVSWKETAYERSGRQISQRFFDGVLITEIVTGAAVEKANPLGLFVKEMSWDEKEVRR